MSESSNSELPDDVESKLNGAWENEGLTPAQAGVEFGQTVGPYRVRAFLGAGSFGLVYLADDVETNRPVALKLPRIEVLLDKEKCKRFRIEANIIGRLSHPGIVRILRSDVDESATPYIACDWCTGPDVAEYLDKLRDKGLALPSWQESVRLMINVAEAIDFAHEQGITHRDVKPANVILDRNLDADETAKGLDGYVPRITDFGLARLANPTATTTRTGVVLGTPAYMAPERILVGLSSDSESTTHTESIKSDIYSLGAVLFELLTGVPPAKSKSWLELIRKERSSSFSSDLNWPDDVPSPLKKVVETCLRHQPEVRYHSAAELVTDLRRLLSGKPPVGRPIGVLTRFRLLFTTQDWMVTAGWFAIVSQSIFMVWMMLGDVFKVWFELLTASQYLNLLPTLLVIAVSSSVSVIATGVFCLYRKRWAPWLGAFLSACNLYSPTLALLGKPPIFAQIYMANTPYMLFLIHLVIVIIFSLQFVLFLFAIGERRLSRKGGFQFERQSEQ